MSLLKNTFSTILKRVIIINLLLIGIIFFVFKEPMPYVKGLIFGSSINVLNFRLMSITLAKSTQMNKKRIMAYVMGNYMIRYVIYAMVLAISVVADYLSFYTTALGFFMVKIVILSDTFFDLIYKKTKNN
ncbi:ATP synthase subunit I [Clostridiaceae bacterium M8S5]|nr:ATP synthase subunit I [Clostridiaceae bacterium M8S5]